MEEKPISQLSNVLDYIENKYNRELKNKEIYKLIHNIHFASNELENSLDLPYFWYMFGTVSPIEKARCSDVYRCKLSNSQKNLIDSVIDEYRRNDLEYMTDKSYEKSPKDIQEKWRELDKKVRTLHPDYEDFFSVNPSKDEILQSVEDVYFSSRDQEYREFLDKWAYAINVCVTNEGLNPKYLMYLNNKFWRLYSLEIATKHRNNVSISDVEDCLEIADIETEKNRQKNEIDNEFNNYVRNISDSRMNVLTQEIIESI